MNHQLPGPSAPTHRPQEAQVLQHRRREDRLRGRPGRAHQHDHADRFFKLSGCCPSSSPVPAQRTPSRRSTAKKGDKIVNNEHRGRVPDPGEPGRGQVSGLLAEGQGRGSGVPQRARLVKDVMRPNPGPEGRRTAGERLHRRRPVPVATSLLREARRAINVPEWIADNCIQCKPVLLRLPSRGPSGPCSSPTREGRAPPRPSPSSPPRQELKAPGSACRSTPWTAWAAGTAPTSVRPRKGPGHEAHRDPDRGRGAQLRLRGPPCRCAIRASKRESVKGSRSTSRS
jgi:hypothetical protein